MVYHVTLVVAFCTALRYLSCCHATEADPIKISFAIDEEMPEGYEVGNTAVNSGILQKIPQQKRASLLFNFLDSKPDKSYFRINRTTGILTTALIIDRETVCEFSIDCVKEFDIAVTADGLFVTIISVNVTIEDINDNVPVFPENSTKFEMSEGVNIGYEFRIKSASDKDTGGNNSIQSYSLIQENSTFKLESTKTLGGNFVLKLILVGNLDRETRDRYFLVVVVRDGGVPPKSGTLNVTIIITDVNDNAPKFLSDSYNVTIEKNLTPSTVILKLEATDPDQGENGRVSYRIAELQKDVSKIKEMFYLNETTGEASVIKDLRYEGQEQFNFIVEAYDHGLQYQFTQKEINVFLKDAGNNPPIVHVNFLSPGNIGFVNVTEEIKHAFVAYVNVEDSDKGSNGDVSCNVTNNLFDVKEYTNKGFMILVRDVLDREILDLYNVTVMCHDMGVPSLSASLNFLVRVMDINDNAPVFINERYVANVTENVNIGTRILQVSATDTDIGLNSIIEYYVHPDDTEKVAIEAKTGFITSSSNLDRESVPEFNVWVLSIDKGEPPLTGSALVTIIVEDVNDNAPKIITTSARKSVPENLPAGTDLGFIEALDMDAGINSELTFSVLDVGGTMPFIILPSGSLRTKVPLDREKQNRYDFTVMVTDKGKPPLFSTAVVIVYVEDINDNPPIIQNVNNNNKTITIFYPTEILQSVANISAHDIDDGENGTLVYYISQGNDYEIFSIDRYSGMIYVDKILDIQYDRTVILVIVVKDLGNPPLNATTTLNIKLVYRNATDMMKIGIIEDNKYIIIAVVVVISTVLFAVAIVGVILFLRNLDRSKHAPEVGHPSQYSDSGVSSGSGSMDLTPENEISDEVNCFQQKKKEVSFSLDKTGVNKGVTESNENGIDPQSEHGFHVKEYLGNGFSENGALQRTFSPDKLESQIKAINLQRCLWESKSKDWHDHEEQNHPRPGDDDSETSKETITCDSGRGGSEDGDSNTSPAADNPSLFVYPELKNKCHKQVSFQNNHTQYQADLHTRYDYDSYHNTLSTNKHSGHTTFGIQSKLNTESSQPPYIPMRNQTLYPSACENSPKSEIQCGNCDSNRDTWTNLYTVPAMSLSGGVQFRIRHDSTSTRSGDDDVSTTTSGSYTLDPDELDTYLFSKSKDLVV
ncbi:hypothetical protein CHS0354_010691 [Potamilus streckersoni]|uniref:Cadherin domain-containing protein n=1 Tax=Potamilus streckersoni TaxID=2493646 RepID=A0AAE0TCY9_9BIVA|nr:hypothetical protein CHS0354_010691 [Potamilus streckersoni]